MIFIEIFLKITFVLNIYCIIYKTEIRPKEAQFIAFGNNTHNYSIPKRLDFLKNHLSMESLVKTKFYEKSVTKQLYKPYNKFFLTWIYVLITIQIDTPFREIDPS